MAISKDLETQILKIVAGLFNAAPGGTNLTELANLVDGGMSISQLSDALAANTLFTNGIMAGKVTVDDQVEVLMNHFGVVADSDSASAGSQAQAYFTQQIENKVGFGKIVYDAVTFLSSTTDAAFTTAATLLANKALVAEEYSKTTSSSDLATLQTIVGSVKGDHPYTAADVAQILKDVGAVAGKSFTLTSDSDTGSAFAGTSADDTFNGQISATASSNTFNLTDTISGGSGTDTLSLTALDYADNEALTVASVSGFEVLTLRAADVRAADATAGDDILVTATNFPGLTAFNNDRSTSNVQISALAAGTSVNVMGNGTLPNADTTAAYGATVTAGTLNLKGGVTAGAVALNGAGLTTVAIGSSGAANVAGAISTNSAVVTAVTIAAEKALTTTGLTVENAGAVNASLTISGAATDTAATTTAAATSAVVLGTLDTDFTSVDASGLTAGGVSATLSATVAATFKGGAGNDTVTTSTSGQTGSVDAGAGTGDILVLAASGHIDTTAEGAIYKGFEVLQAANGAAIDMDLITGSTIASIMLADGAGTTSVTDMSATQAAHVTVTAGAGAMTLGVKGSTTVGTLNTLSITVSDGDTTGSEAVWGTGDLTLAGVETINLAATDDVLWATMANVTGLTSLVATGDGDVSITTGAHVATANESINFSALTAASTFDFSGATTNAMAFTGGKGVDTVTDSAVGGNVISTGAGRDVVTLTAKTSGSSGDTITLGAGGDSLVATAAKGNDASDVLTLTYAAGDSVIDSSVTGTGFVAATMDAITGIDFAAAAAAAAGHVITFDTVESATAVTFSSSAPTFGTTTVTNANDFYVYNTGAGGITYIYQDTDGDKIIENGEFGVQLTGVAATASTSTEFTIVSGDLLLSTL